MFDCIGGLAGCVAGKVWWEVMCKSCGVCNWGQAGAAVAGGAGE